MEILVVEGGTPLRGEISVGGAKNAALPIMCAALLVEEGETVLENVPDIDDVRMLSDIMTQLGVKVHRDSSGLLHINASRLTLVKLSYEQTKKLRASNLLLGPLLARLGKAEIPMPGGCDIGSRPMDLHIKGLEKLGAVCSLDHGVISAEAECLVAGNIYLDFPSVGATENIMVAAALAGGTTIIENVAKEPEIVDLASFLGTLGVRVRGAGTDVIKIDGIESIRGGITYTIIPDRIEAGTYMVMGALPGSDIMIRNVIPKHLESITAKLQEIGVHIETGEDCMHVTAAAEYKATDLKTFPYPGFPTDVQSQFMALLTSAVGESVITETVFENRLKLADELNRMGAVVHHEGRTAIVTGQKSKLSGAPVRASDLRAGAALVIAGILAEGYTEISNVEVIDRGYEKLEKKLRQVGAKIYRRRKTGVDVIDSGYGKIQEKVHQIGSTFSTNIASKREKAN